MNKTQRNNNRTTAEALHYAVQKPVPKFGRVSLSPFATTGGKILFGKVMANAQKQAPSGLN